MNRTTRRDVLGMAGATALVMAAPRVARANSAGHVVIIGGGFGGAACARYLRRIAPEVEVTLIEQNPAFVTCPFSNTVLGGLNDIGFITHEFAGLEAAGVQVIIDRAEAIDAEARTVRLAGGGTVPYSKLVVSPGIDFKWNAIEGYDEAAAEVMPHAYKAGPQTTLLRRQLEAMDDGGTVIMSIPANPYRCPPGPYERASLIAHYLKTEKPRSKLILLDAKDAFSKQALFEEGWAEFYADIIEWVPFSMTGSVTRVDPAAMTIETEFDSYTADVANIIPPQRSGRIVDTAGLAEGDDWCQIDPVTFESRVVPDIHLLGDSVIAGAMPKSGFSATSQAKYCAHVLAAQMNGAEMPTAGFVNTCYSLVTPDYGISVADVFRISPEGAIVTVEGAGGVSPLGRDAEFRSREADYARGWYASMTQEIFG